MDTRTMIIQGSIMLLLVGTLSFGLHWMDNNNTLTQAETMSTDEATATTSSAEADTFVACPMSQGMLIGKQPFFMYQDTESLLQGQLQAVKVAAGIGGSDTPICRYYNSQSKSIFSIVLPGKFDKSTCTAENTYRVGFVCK